MSPTSEVPGLSEDQGRWLEAWKKAEDIAVHFNQLIINFRLQALGVVTVAGGLVGTILLGKDGVSPSRANYTAFTGAMAFLALLWVAIWIIDLGYYNRLLMGAVAEAERLEGESNGVVHLSRKISESARGDTLPRKAFYVLPLLGFLVAGMIAWNARASAPADVGCTKDAECKGERICSAGACVDPPTRPAPAGK